MTANPSPPKPRWYQFRLITLAVMVFVFAAGVLVGRWSARPVIAPRIAELKATVAQLQAEFAAASAKSLNLQSKHRELRSIASTTPGDRIALEKQIAEVLSKMRKQKIAVRAMRRKFERADAELERLQSSYWESLSE